MRDPASKIRKAVYDSLSDVISCAVYNRVPNNASMPYVIIGGQNSSDNQRTKDTFLYEHSILVEIITGNESGAGGDIDADNIADEICVILNPLTISEYIQPASQFKIIVIELESSNAFNEDTETMVINRRLMRFRMIVEELEAGIGEMIIGSTFKIF